MSRRAALGILCCLWSAAVSAAIPPAERAALVAIYNALEGPNWKNRTNWLGAPGTECTWSGVTCDSSNATVTQLSIEWNRARGTFPREIADLTNLEVFRANGSKLTGPLPPEIGRLSKLRILDLTGQYSDFDGGNDLSGPIPREIGQLTSLRELYLSVNLFTGSIPAELGALTNLEVFEAGYNQLAGPIPAPVLRMPALRRLNLSGNDFEGLFAETIDLPSLERLDLDGGNRFSGSLPAGIGRSTRLREIRLSGNQFSGPIPAEIGDLAQLVVFDVYANRLEGTLAPLAGLANLEVISIANNRLSGSVPPSIGQLRNLVVLSVAGNRLSGELPPEFFTLTKLVQFEAHRTELGGNLADFAKFPALRSLLVAGTKVRGPFPVELTQVTSLETLDLAGITLGGALPREIGDLKNLRSLSLAKTGLTGIPDEIGVLTELRDLDLNGNQISRQIAGGFLGKLTKLVRLYIADNRFEGPIPPDLFSSATLLYLDVSGNRFTGTVPPVSGSPKLLFLDVSRNRLTALPADFDALKDITELYLGENEFAGAVPPAIAQLTTLRQLSLHRNRFSGPIPELRTLTQLRTLWLSGNEFSGPIPDWLGGLTRLDTLILSQNKLTGRVPPSITALTNLRRGQFSIDDNALYTDNAPLKAFLDALNPAWMQTQTVAPADLRVTAQRKESLTVSWTPIAFSSGPGGYQISYGTSPQGPFQVVTTPNKSTSTFIVDSLQPSTGYFFSVSTVSYPNGSQRNVVVSDQSAQLTASTTAGAPAPASVVVFVHPREISARVGESKSTSYVLGNVGDEPASIVLQQQGDFFTHDATSFTIVGGEQRRVVVTGKPQASVGAFVGESLITGTGVPAGLSARVGMLVTEPPAGEVVAQPSANRIDVAAKVTDSATGTVDFRNVGTATLQGIVISSVPWILPPSDLVVIPAGETRTVTFRIDQTKRPDASSPAGAVTGTLSLVYETRASGKGEPEGSHGVTITTPVTVVYTITPPVDAVTVPTLAQGEVALFVAGVGHVVGGRGLFISDVAIVNAFGVTSPGDIRMYYSPADSSLPSKVTAVTSLAPNQGVTFGNVVKSVFENANIGTLQIRTRSLDQLFVNANIFNVTDRNGTYGTALPIFRSDRALRAGESVFLTGLRRDAARGTYTNIFIQETSGMTAQYEIEFFDVAGQSVGAKRSGSIAPFRLATIFDSPADPSVPVGAVAARITNPTGSAGRIVAFATPLDALSSDFWTVADWNREFGSAPEEAVIIPIAGSLRGNLNTFYRTDVAITNRSAAAARGTFRFYEAGGTFRARDVEVAAGASAVIDDFVGTSFGVSNTFGFLEFTPADGAFSLTSRTFATTPALAGTFGTSVPALPRSSALRLGQSKIIAGLDVASPQTIAAAKPGTFRTNVGLVEVTGKSATVEVTVVYTDIKQIVSGIRLTTVRYELAPNQSLIDGIAARIQAANPNVSDLRSVQLKFRVVAGEGAVIAYTSSIDNGTADQVFRIE